MAKADLKRITNLLNERQQMGIFISMFTTDGEQLDILGDDLANVMHALGDGAKPFMANIDRLREQVQCIVIDAMKKRCDQIDDELQHRHGLCFNRQAKRVFPMMDTRKGAAA
jgi:hypothetical protein